MKIEELKNSWQSQAAKPSGRIEVMKEIRTFKHEVFGSLRAILTEDGEPLLMGSDVAKRLGYKNPQKALRDHVDEEDKTLNESFTVNGTHPILINESGLYSLVLSSKLPQAKAFKRWVTAEVLPQIRKTGGYIPTKDAEGRQLSDEEILMLAERIVGRTLQMLNAPNDDCLTATEVARSWGRPAAISSTTTSAAATARPRSTNGSSTPRKQIAQGVYPSERFICCSCCSAAVNTFVFFYGFLLLFQELLFTFATPKQHTIIIKTIILWEVLSVQSLSAAWLASVPAN